MEIAFFFFIGFLIVTAASLIWCFFLGASYDNDDDDYERESISKKDVKTG